MNPRSTSSQDPLLLNLLAEAKRKLIAVERNFNLQNKYQEFSDNLKSIELRFENASQSALKDEKNESITRELKQLILDIHEAIAPFKVSVTSKLYNQTIQRICYRGDDRPPITKNGDGVFNVGFTKQKKSADYQKWVEQFYYSESITADIRVIKPFSTNRDTTNPTSRDPRSAAFFPIVFKLTKLNLADILDSLQSELVKNHIGLDIKEEFHKKISHIENAELLILLNKVTYSEAQKSILIGILNQYFNDDNQIEKILLGIETRLLAALGIKDTSWIYVVFVDKGFDVSSHGYTHVSLFKPPQKHHYTFVAQEICSDEIPPQHVIAAVKITRDFTNMRLDRENMHSSGRFYGEANFVVEDIIYNQSALHHFKEFGIDVEHYKDLLNSYFEKHIKQSINLSDDGYVIPRRNI